MLALCLSKLYHNITFAFLSSLHGVSALNLYQCLGLPWVCLVFLLSAPSLVFQLCLLPSRFPNDLWTHGWLSHLAIFSPSFASQLSEALSQFYICFRRSITMHSRASLNSSTISSLLISCSLDAAFLRVASTYTVLVSTLLTSVSDQAPAVYRKIPVYRD